MRFILVLILLITVCCFSCACTSAPPAPQNVSSSDKGISDITQPSRVFTSTLDEAMVDLEWYHSQGTINTTGLSIRQVNGFGVGSDGAATTWFLGVQQEETAELLVYTNNEWKRMAWGAPLPEEEIILQNVTPPEALYEQQSALIGEKMRLYGTEESNLELKEGVYTITVASNTAMSMLTFDAGTGELISSI
jgi:hypothetical protein